MKNGLHFSTIGVLALAGITFFLSPSAVIAQDSTDSSEKWEFTVAPYILFPNMRGETTIRSLTVDVNANTSDIFSRLDFGAMLYAEMSNNKWAITFDMLYMSLSDQGILPLTQRQATVNMKQYAVELVGLRRLARWVELGIGGRLNVVEGGLIIPPGDNLPGRDLGQTETWFDPLIAYRFTLPNDSKWNFAVRGDIGGFGIGSKFSWQIYPVVGYRFSRLFELVIAFRALGMDYVNSDESFKMDKVLFGPEIGFLFHF